MGNILSSACCEQKVEPPKSLLQQGHFTSLNQDYQYFFGQDWFGVDKPLFEPQKFIFIYPGYKDDQSQMEKFWAKADTVHLRHGELVRQKGKVLNKKWQYLIRKGVPCALAKKIILDTFRLTYVDCEEEYKSAVKAVFKNKPIPKTFKNVPLFGCSSIEDDDEEFNYLNESEKKIQLVLKVQILNQQGMDALIRLLWIVNNLNHYLEYNPMLLHIIVLLLIFLGEAQTYCVLQFMIKDSQQSLNDNQTKQQLKWHLIMNENHFKEIATTFYETVSRRSKTFSQIYQFMKQIQFDSFELFQEMSVSLMLCYLPFSAALKIFIMYLNEGIKMYFRMLYSVLRNSADEIKSCKTSSCLKQTLKKKLMNMSIEEQNDLIKKAFHLKLNESEQVNSYMRTAVSYTKQQPCYLPIPSHESELISNEQFEILWDWLSNLYKLCDPYLIFSTKLDGHSLRSLYLKCQEYVNYPVLLVIQTNQNIVFGAFCDKMLQVHNKYVGSNETFLFTLQPEERKFNPTQGNRDHMMCALEYFAFGSGKNGPAFQIDSELNKGYTYQSDTYDNPLFSESKSQNRFKCLSIEVYYLK